MEKNLYPIGTVVELNVSPSLRFMIIGYTPTDNQGANKDYVAVAYPVGCVNSQTFFAFNEDEVNNVVFEGYKNNVFDNFKEFFLQNKAEDRNSSNN